VRSKKCYAPGAIKVGERKMAIEFILEAGIISFTVFFIVALATACIAVLGMAAEAFQLKRTAEGIWCILGFFFLVSVLLIAIGAIAFAVTV